MIKKIYQDNYDPKKYSLKSSNNKKQLKERDESWNNAEKLSGKKVGGHLNAMEIEADRYSANNISSSALKRGVRNLIKTNKKTFSNKKKFVNNQNKAIRYQLKEYGRLNEYKDYKINKDTFSDDEIKALKKNYNIASTGDYNARSKALKDKKMINSNIYK